VDRQDWDARYAAAELVWSAEPNRWVAAEIDGLAPGRALDLGAGEGRNAIWLAGLGWQVTAVDFSAVALDKGRRLLAAAGCAPESVGWVLADLRDYEPPPAAFDLVLLAYLQVPAGVRRQVLSRAAAALAPGAVLLVVAHDRANLTGGVGGPADPAVLYTAEDVLADLTDRPELRVERAGQVRRPVQTPDGVRDALDLLVRLRRP
jgi:SAM-dependent methyltransferase